MNARAAELYRLHLAAAVKGRSFVDGKDLGPSPRFLIVGDRATERDVLVGSPFSGILNDVLVRTLASVKEKFKAEPADCRVTYLVKAVVPARALLDNDVVETWLPIIQLEYAAGSFEALLAVGPLARSFAGFMTYKPAMFAGEKPTFMQRLGSAWRMLTS